MRTMRSHIHQEGEVLCACGTEGIERTDEAEKAEETLETEDADDERISTAQT